MVGVASIVGSVGMVSIAIDVAIRIAVSVVSIVGMVSSVIIASDVTIVIRVLVFSVRSGRVAISVSIVIIGRVLVSTDNACSNGSIGVVRVVSIVVRASTDIIVIAVVVISVSAISVVIEIDVITVIVIVRTVFSVLMFSVVVS